MNNYNYKARDRYGVLTTGIIDAENSKEVALQLERRHYTPVSIEAVEEEGVAGKLSVFFNSFQKVSPDELVVFTRQLASILEAGVPLTDGLDALQEQLKNKGFQKVVLQVKREIEGGASFSDALEKHEKIFSKLVINMVRAGERAGILDEVLETVSTLLDKEIETAGRVKSATRYPLIVSITMIIAFMVLTTFIIPKFAKFFAAFKTELPLPTRILIWFNNVLVNYWFIILGVFFLAIYVIKRVLDTDKGRYAWDRLMLSTPIFGPLFSKIYLSRFSRMLAAMIRSGIPILQALEITSATVENKVISKVILDVRDKVSQGKSLAEPMKGSKIFPPIAISMVAIGERAGSLEKMLNKVSDYFDRESDYTVKNLTPLLEPILIFGLGMMMLVFALGIFLPMWDLVKVYRNY
ncbi:MAG: type II secretion system F family protein [Candidatus Margulisiibacteriota bacterium]|nr:type II secretion system F family protein [Candidatus Margulisiibacteriota bacterium]